MFDMPTLTDLFITKEHPLKTSYKRTRIPLLVSLFVSLIELEDTLKTSNKRTHV